MEMSCCAILYDVCMCCCCSLKYAECYQKRAALVVVFLFLANPTFNIQSAHHTHNLPQQAGMGSALEEVVTRNARVRSRF
jgi:hypothetical protein